MFFRKDRKTAFYLKAIDVGYDNTIFNLSDNYVIIAWLNYAKVMLIAYIPLPQDVA